MLSPILLAAVLGLPPAVVRAQIPDPPLPDAPSHLLISQDVASQNDAVAIIHVSGKNVAPCTIGRAMKVYLVRSPATPSPCAELYNPYQRFLDTNLAIPLTRRQKGYLAIHGISDPATLATIIASSGFSIAIDSHTAYGPGIRGFAYDSGVSLSQAATGELFGTFLIPALTHEDPRYHRMPHAPIPRRILHAISRTVIAQHDNGSNMPNYATLLTYPIVGELSNLYVPGIHSNGPSTARRILFGLALDPSDALINEFLPDVAKRVHIRVIFFQQILNQIATGPPGSL